MAKQKFTAQLHWKRGFNGEGSFRVFQTDMSLYGYVPVSTQEFEYELPEAFDPVPLQLAALTEEERKLRADFAKRITDLQRQKNELLAIEMAP